MTDGRQIKNLSFNCVLSIIHESSKLGNYTFIAIGEILFVLH